MAAAETFLGGGTNFQMPLDEALRLMEENGFENADVVFITDGECACRMNMRRCWALNKCPDGLPSPEFCWIKESRHGLQLETVLPGYLPHIRACGR